MSDAFQDLGKLVPGFDFIQSLMKNANAAMPHFGQWLVPTLDPEELEKRITELRTVQFWLEQNARLIGTTIQALEVQRMTLSTLRTMNVPLDSLRDAMTIPPEAASTNAGAFSGSFFNPAGGAAPTAAAPEPGSPPPAEQAAASEAASAAPGGLVDPMQWWGALSQQFSTLTAQALQDPSTQAAAQAATRLAGDWMKQSLTTAEEALRHGLAATMPAAPAPESPDPSASAAAPGKNDAARKPAAARKRSAAKSTPRARKDKEAG